MVQAPPASLYCHCGSRNLSLPKGVIEEMSVSALLSGPPLDKIVVSRYPIEAMNPFPWHPVDLGLKLGAACLDPCVRGPNLSVEYTRPSTELVVDGVV